MAAQPPGPGLPRHAPSVKISTSAWSAIDTVSCEICNPAVKAQPAQIFEGILRPHERPRRLIEPIEKTSQQEAQSAAAREQGQRAEFRRRERPGAPIRIDQ